VLYKFFNSGGSVELLSGQSKSGRSGSLNISTPSAPRSGFILMQTGMSTSGSSGSLNFSTGDAVNGASGDVIFAVGKLCHLNKEDI